MMIRAYRMRGHLHANLDPLGLEQRHDHGELHPETYGFTDEYDRKGTMPRRRMVAVQVTCAITGK